MEDMLNLSCSRLWWLVLCQSHIKQTVICITLLLDIIRMHDLIQREHCIIIWIELKSCLLSSKLKFFSLWTDVRMEKIEICQSSLFVELKHLHSWCILLFKLLFLLNVIVCSEILSSLRLRFLLLQSAAASALYGCSEEERPGLGGGGREGGADHAGENAGGGEDSAGGAAQRNDRKTELKKSFDLLRLP